jgi:hypothetical protein
MSLKRLWELEKKMLELQQSWKQNRKEEGERHVSNIEKVEKSLGTERLKTQELQQQLQKSQKETADASKQAQKYKEALALVESELAKQKEKTEKLK